MTEHTPPQRGRTDPYCWICRGYGCDNPRRVIGDVATWSPERVITPVHTGDESLSWLTGPAVAWWFSHRSPEAA